MPRKIAEFADLRLSGRYDYPACRNVHSPHKAHDNMFMHMQIEAAVHHPAQQ